MAAVLDIGTLSCIASWIFRMPLQVSAVGIPFPCHSACIPASLQSRSAAAFTLMSSWYIDVLLSEHCCSVRQSDKDTSRDPGDTIIT